MNEADTVTQQLELGFQDWRSEDRVKRLAARSALATAASLGRSDAYLLLGKSYELEKDYPEAVKAYRMGLEQKHRASAYRLAKLHGLNLVASPDREFYLETIRRFASEGHLPSLGDYNRECLSGSYGWQAVLLGAVMFVPNFVRIAWVAYRDPHSPRLQS
jgi:TPR repeat protein